MKARKGGTRAEPWAGEEGWLESVGLWAESLSRCICKLFCFLLPSVTPELLINLVKVFQKKNEDFPIPDPANLYV